MSKINTLQDVANFLEELKEFVNLSSFQETETLDKIDKAKALVLLAKLETAEFKKMLNEYQHILHLLGQINALSTLPKED